MWAARPNTRHDSGVEAAVALDHAVDAFDRVASGVVGCPLRGAVGVALVVVDLVDAEGDHPIAAVFAVGHRGDRLVGVYAPGEEPTVRRRPPPGALAFVFVPRFLQSAFKQGLSERDIQYALDNPLEAEGITTRRGNPGLSVEGLSASGLPIQVLGEYDPVTGDLVVYHAHRL